MTTLATIAQTCTAQCRIDSPLGPLLLARTAKGLAGVWFDGQQHHPQRLSAPRPAGAGRPPRGSRKVAEPHFLERAPQRPSDELLLRVQRQLARYFEGDAVIFDVPLDLHGTPFQRGVWQALLRIERGATSRYGEIASQVGAPSAVRAVGAAVGRNPLSIIVPCHRVLGAGGALTGYAGGLERKVALLELERARPRPASAAPERAREAAAA